MKNNSNQSYIPVAEPANQQQYNNMENGGGYGQQQYKQGKPGNQQYSQLNDFQQQQSMYLAEAEKSVRMGFVRKVYGILMIQL